MESESYKNRICCKLDWPNLHWKRLLEILNAKRILDEPYSFLFEANYYGGGSPTIVMFDEIMRRQPGHSLLDFIANLREIQQNDVALHLEEIMKARRWLKSLEDLETNEKQFLKKLDKEENWKLLAEKYGFTLEERNSFNRVRIQPNEWSPTKAVLERVTERCPGYLLEEFKACLREMDRNDLGNIIEEFIKDKRLQQIEEQQSLIRFDLL